MSVWFAYRCPYLGPTEKHVRRFDDATVLDWFRRIWRPIPDWKEAEAYGVELLGCRVYSLATLFHDIAEYAEDPPRTMGELAGAVESYTYNNHVLHGPHCLQVYTDDDDIDMAWFFLDDQYLAEHEQNAAFLLREDWQLPEGAGAGGFVPSENLRPAVPAGSHVGTTYVLRFSSDPDHLESPAEVLVLDGLRLPQLTRHLFRAEAAWGEDYCYTLGRISERVEWMLAGDEPQEASFLAALEADPRDDAVWHIYSDWREEMGLRSPDLDLLERTLPRLYPQEQNLLLHIGNHTAECLVNDEQWYFFDDVWASAQPVLANSLLRYAARWDVLTV
jgi:hypothetical protein